MLCFLLPFCFRVETPGDKSIWPELVKSGNAWFTMFHLSPGSLSLARTWRSSGIDIFASTFNKRDFDPLLRKHEASPKLKEKKTLYCPSTMNGSVLGQL